MARFIVSARIEGSAWVEVEADNKEDAVEKSRLSDGWEVDDWDINDSPHKGGYIEANAD